MATIKQNRGTAFSVTLAGTSSAQPVTTGTTVQYYVTDISGSSSGTAGTWVLLGGTTGTTVFWQGSGTVNATFSEPLTLGTVGTISFLINGTTTTQGNISGFFI